MFTQSKHVEPDHSNQGGHPRTEGAEQGPFGGGKHTVITIPDHVMLRRIGWGSYGQVWLARNIMGAYRAVKVISRNSFTEKRPFDREVSGIRSFEPVSRLHGGFVDVLHTGMNEEAGYFYYIMELADDVAAGGVFDPEKYAPNTLSAELCRRGRLPLQECLRLGVDLTQALSDLHRHGLVHRDIKPANIVFISGRPKLADIGLVADVHEARSYVGTMGFIPPEGPGTAQSDLFSLGKVLYEASTGLDRLDFPEIPAAWSDAPDYPGLLEFNEVLLRACNPNPGRRYASALDMHADLLLVLNGKSVKRLRLLEERMTRLKRTAGIAAVVLGAASPFFYQVYRERSNALETRREQVSANVSRGNRAVDSGDLLGALPYFARALELDRGDARAEMDHRLCLGAVLEQCPRLTQMWMRTNRVNHAEFSPAGDKVLLAQHMGNAEVWDYRTGRMYLHPFGPKFGIHTAAYSPNASWIATASQGHTAILWNADSLSRVHDLPHTNSVFSIKFSPKGDRVVTACRDGHAYIWEVKSGELLYTLGNGTHEVFFADFSHNGKWVALATSDDEVSIWSAENGRPTGMHFPHANWVWAVAFSPDDQRLVTACDDHQAHVWDLTTGRPILPSLRHDNTVRSVQFSPDGRFILTASTDGTARLWRADDLQPLETNPILRHKEGLTDAEFSPDGRLVVTSSLDGSVQVWDLAGGTMKYVLRHGSFSGDGSRYLVRANNALEIRDTVSDKVVSSVGLALSPAQRVQLSQDGAFLVNMTAGATPGSYLAQVRNVAQNRPRGPGLLVTNGLDGLVLTKDGKRAATWSGPTCQVWDVGTGSLLSDLRLGQVPIGSVAFSPSGDQVLTVSSNQVQVWETVTGRPAYAAFAHPAEVRHAEFSPNGLYVITCCADEHWIRRYAQIWDAATGKAWRDPLWHDDGVLYATFNSDGNRIATASEDFTAAVWETRTGFRLSLPLKHADQIRWAAFAPGRQWLATASSDRSARIWDPDIGEPLTPPLRYLKPLAKVAFMPGGRHLLITDQDGDAFLWALPLGEGSPRDLMDLATLLSGAQPAPAPRTGSDLNSAGSAWDRLHVRFPNLFETSPDEILRWHRLQADESEASADWVAAKFHLQRLIELRPDDPSLHVRLTEVEKHLQRGPGQAAN